ncbi:MAG TPA: aldo/keto reductase [Gemmatimonadales bacterium]|jgi:aryl-alcohol dehydrogenase-like predicted oxidoreductase|nr:aldo/keto reductase [Gemmatimonadales bacterium]
MHAGARTDVGPPPRFITAGPQLGFGAWAVGGGGWGVPGDPAEREAAVHRALERGITFFDTAPTYGDGASETLLGRALRGSRDRVTIATKVGPKGDPRASLEDSLRRLDTPYVDLVQLHEALGEWERILEALHRLQDEGKARAVGLCNATHLQIRRAREIAPVVAYQGPYNLFDRDVEQRDLPLCRDQGLGFLAYRPLASGLLAGTYNAPPTFSAGDHRRSIYWFKGPEFERRRQIIERLRPIADREGMKLPALALAWVYSQPGVSVVLAGARSAEQVDQNLAGTRHLTRDTCAAIDEIVADEFRPARATAACRQQASSWGVRERFIVEGLDGRTPYEAIAAAWTDRGDKPMVAAQVKVFADQLAQQGLTAER